MEAKDAEGQKIEDFFGFRQVKALLELQGLKLILVISMPNTFLHLARGYAEAKELAGETDKLRAYKGNILHQVRKSNVEIETKETEPVTHLTIPGIAEDKVLSLRKFFNLPEIPKRLLIIGSDQATCETARALKYLGTKVTMVTESKTLSQEGIEIFTNSLIKHFEGGYAMVEQVNGDQKILHKVSCDQLLIGSEIAPKRRLFFLNR